MSQIKSASKPKQVAAAIIGNALEWYDFIIYGYMAKLFSSAFFVSDNPYNSLLIGLATFGVGFFMRPVGGIILGIYADKKGRKAALQLIIIITTAAIALITFAPTYQTIGIAAPLIIILARLLQGFATGGEFAGATAFLMESAPKNRRGLFSSFQFFGQFLALAFGSIVGALVTNIFTDEQVAAWGWRIPFAVGLLIAPVGFWIRRHMTETDDFVHKKESIPINLIIPSVLKKYPREIFVAFGLCAYSTACTYVLTINITSFASTTLGLPMDKIFLVQIASALWMVAMIPFFGYLSDLFGRKVIITFGVITSFLAVYPFYAWIVADPTITKLFIMQFSLFTLIGITQAPMPALFAESFPTHVRATALSISYNFAIMIFGGFSPFIVTWLVQASGNAVAPTWYVLATASMAFAAILLMKDKYQPNRSA